ncbi:MAG: InlB B-repeat-containing protein, partial [Dethiobacteria bacterium]
VTALPFVAAAQETAAIIEPLDFTLDSSDPLYPGESGEGWTWDAAAKTLTLSGINLDVGLKEEEFAIQLPDGAKIVLAEGTNNSISNSYGMGILCCDGSLEVTGGGNLSLDTNFHGIRAYRNLTIDMTGNLGITVGEYMGLRVGKPGEGGDLVIRNCNTLSLLSEDDQCIRVDGDVSISNCGQVSVSGLDYNGIRNFGDVNITGCSQVSISGYYNGIRCAGDVVIANCPDIQIRSIGELDEEDEDRTDLNGIYTDSGSVTITNSALTVYGAAFGIATGPTCASGVPGGDIIINNSFVNASCSDWGYAAIFAGDDIPFGGEGEHARILLNGCAITAPEGGRVLDVNIEIGEGVGCQSITGLADITAIDEPEQMAKDVTIKPLYTLTYDANGGSGSMTDANSPYIAGTQATVLPCAFTPPAGYVFSSWNTAADGSGTSYAPGAAFAIAGNTTLYAQYTAGTFTVTFDSQGGSAVAAVTVPANGTITAPPAPTRAGYTFGGWYKDADCKSAWDFAADRVTGNITLYAKWIPEAQLPATFGQSNTLTASLLAMCLLGGLLMLVLHKRRKEYA